MMKSPEVLPAERITIMLDHSVGVKLRNLQSKKIKTLQTSYSFSRAINEVLKGTESL